ncbi:malonate transporter subunit MadL [Robiginitalea sediminis]|uniref:malonate transporter subunit MadL n=1 Tax=Robiginitalea sediminis TaxID=1982593 RepID=UPI000B4B4434|nr:malonate transporter subunit MadL [Robiginitalea sediminis]
MKIYGVALLCACFLAGKSIGHLLGELLGIPGDIGGVGFAMLLLMGISAYLRKRGRFSAESETGITFWSAMYIPIIVAMAATLNVKAAFSGGWTALLAGAAATLAGFLLVPVLTRLGAKGDSHDNPEH